MHVLAPLRARPLLAVVLVAGLVVVGVLAFPLFAPKSATHRAEAPPAMAADGVVKQGAFHDGAPGHTVRGTASILRTPDGGHVLRLEGYQATDGPDVYFFLTRTPDPRSTAEVDGGLRVLVPGGSEDGEATLRGDFNVPLPAGFDPSLYQGLAAWCDRFDTLFGSAALA